MGHHLGTSAGTFPADNLSVMCHSILREVPLTFWKWFEVVPPMFNLGLFWAPLMASAGTIPTEYLSVMVHLILCGLLLKCWEWFGVVPPMFNLPRFLGHFEGSYVLHPAEGPRQTSRSVYDRRPPLRSTTQTLVPRSFNQNPASCRTICFWVGSWNSFPWQSSKLSYFPMYVRIPTQA